MEENQDDGADDGHHEAHRIAFLIQAGGAPEHAAEEPSGNPEQHRHQDASRIAAGDQEFGDEAHEQAEYHPADHNHTKEEAEETDPPCLGRLTPYGVRARAATIIGSGHSDAR